MKNLFTYFFGVFMLCCIVSTSNAQTDTIAPVVLDFQVEFSEDALTDSVDAVFTLTYSEAIELLDTFTIVTHYDSNGVWIEYDRYDNTEIVLEDDVLTVTPARSFWALDKYEFIVTAAAVRDLQGNLAGAFTRTFVPDEDAPEVIDLTIEFTENDMNDSVSAVFTLTYSEDIQLNNNFIMATHVDENGTWPEYDLYSESEVTVQDSILTITPERQFSNSSRYELIVAWGAVSDLAGNLATSFTRVFKPDVSPPEVIDFDAVFTDTEFPDSVNVSFTLTYNEDVKLPKTFNIVTHYKNAGIWEEFEVFNDSVIAVTGNIITINPKSLYSSASSYELVVTGGSVRDLVDNVADAYTNVFLLDTIPPKLTDISPDLDILVPADASFSFTFDEKVMLIDNFGFYTYYWHEDSAKFIELERLNSSQVTVDENTITFNPDIPLRSATRSQIILTAGSVMDMQGNSFLNVSGGDTTTYVSERFWALDSGITVVSFLPLQGDTLSTIPNELAISFGENITLTDTTAVDSLSLDSLVYLRFNGINVGHEASFDSITNIISIIPAERLIWGRNYTFGFTDGFLNEAMDSIPAQEATFTIRDSVVVINDYAIADINDESMASPLLGQTVRITGTVTAVYLNEGFFVQDANELNSGIWVEYSNTVELAVGEGVIVSGIVEVMDEVTVIVADEVTETDAPLTIEPIIVNFETDSIPMYWGIVVQVTDARASAANAAGEWMLYTADNADSVIISSRLYAYSPVADNTYDLAGVVTFRDNIYRIDPRMNTDILDVTVPTSVEFSPVVNFNVYPNPFADFIKISNIEKLTRVVISNITGQRVVDVTNPDAEINTSHLISGVYIINMFKENELLKTSRLIKQ